MTVSSILNEKGRDTITIDDSAELSEAIALMAAKRIGALVVTGSNGELAGILSERDIVREIAKQGPEILGHRVKTAMTQKVIHAGPSDSVNHVMELMTQGRFRHIPVLENGELIGLVSIGDVVKRKIELAEKEAEEMRNYIAS